MKENILTITKLLAPAVVTSTPTIAAIDLKDNEAATVLVQVGASGDTLSGTVKIGVKLTESSNGTDYTDVAAANLVSGVNEVVIDDAAEDDVSVKFDYIGNCRYIKPAVTFTGTHENGTPVSAVSILGQPHFR